MSELASMRRSVRMEYEVRIMDYHSSVELAKALGVPVQRVNTLINGKRGVTAATALLLAHKFNTNPEFWMNLQNTWDLYEASKDLKLAPV